MLRRQVRFSGDHYQKLRTHLFPGDGCEAVALALCGRLDSAATQALCVNKLLLIPHSVCSERTLVRVTWPADFGRTLYAEAMAKHMAILKIHSHPVPYENFSTTDDHADRELFSSLHGWTDDGLPHASAVMMAGGEMIARFVSPRLKFLPVDRVSVAGDDLQFFDRPSTQQALDPAQLRTAQAFGDRTVSLLSSLSVGIVGCSGTGSWIVEQLSRLGVGRLVLVDPDVTEDKNLNRIVNTRRRDARKARPKVLALAAAVRATGLVRKVRPFQESCFSATVLKELASCDLLFGCMDSHDGRDILNRLATFYCLPYFDLGVHLRADGQGGVSSVCGSVHYLLPGGSSLLSRGVYTPEDLRIASLRRTSPEQFKDEVRRGYIRGAQVDRPAVVTVNGFCATLAANNLLARLHPFRFDPTSAIRWQTFDLVNGSLTSNLDGPACKVLSR